MGMGHGLARVLYAARSVASALGRLRRSESPLAISLTKVMQEPVVRPHDLRNRTKTALSAACRVPLGACAFTRYEPARSSRVYLR